MKKKQTNVNSIKKLSKHVCSLLSKMHECHQGRLWCREKFEFDLECSLSDGVCVCVPVCVSSIQQARAQQAAYIFGRLFMHLTTRQLRYIYMGSCDMRESVCMTESG